MPNPESPVDFLDRRPDRRLLGEEMINLPVDERCRFTPAESRVRGRLIAVGSTLTGVSLIGGAALLVLAAVGALSHGFGGFDIAIAALGGVLLATHWGWVHVAEATADSIEARRSSRDCARMISWLERIKPYTRYSVTTDVLDDGSIRIARLRHRPTLAQPETFTFVTEPDGDEVHAAQDSGVEVTERAEALRRQAALDTDRERQRWELAADAYETELLEGDDERQRLAARRAVARALSEQINSNLRDPPLVE